VVLPVVNVFILKIPVKFCVPELLVIVPVLPAILFVVPPTDKL